ncbi:MAG TPA: hypothetical protein VKF37_06560 [Chloroflexota bacterium]|jgi:hypothetical protein|nr:hypothetical protein [Chloroflexota bacterium]
MHHSRALPAQRVHLFAFFSWPSGAEGLPAGGILLTLVGIVIVSQHHEGVVQAYARAAA